MQDKRRLIIVPIIHNLADFGSLGSRIPFDKGTEALTTQYWNGVLAYVQGLPIDFSQLRVYQDGLPDTSEEDISLILSKAQTPNYNVLRWLKNKGARIIGTEDKDLLVREYDLFQATLIDPTEDEDRYVDARLKYYSETPILLQQRDAYIAQRIRDTLPEGGTGILFIGLGHEVKRLLEQEIEVSEPKMLTDSSSETLRERLPLSYKKERVL